MLKKTCTYLWIYFWIMIVFEFLKNVIYCLCNRCFLALTIVIQFIMKSSYYLHKDFFWFYQTLFSHNTTDTKYIWLHVWADWANINNEIKKLKTRLLESNLPFLNNEIQSNRRTALNRSLTYFFLNQMLMNITKYLHTIIQLYNYKLGIIIKDVTDNCRMNAFFIWHIAYSADC